MSAGVLGGEGGGGGGGSAAGAGAGLIGGIIGPGLSFLGQANSEDFARKLAQRGIRWRAHDMRQAGINPILAARPGGVSGASIGSAGGGNVGSAIASGMEAGTNVGRKREQNRTDRSTQAVNAQSVKESQARERMHESQRLLNDASAVRAISETNATNYENAAREADAQFYSSEEGKAFRNTERRLNAVKDLIPNMLLNLGRRRGNKIRNPNRD